MDNSLSIRPVPHFLNDTIFLSKKARSSTPCKRKIPPRPPYKSLPTISRFFPQPKSTKAQAISFKENDESSLSKDYDETLEESYFQQCFKIEKKIGSGSFGDVFKCISKEDGHNYAIKKSKERYKGKLDRERKLQEVAKHEPLPKHPNLVRFYKAWEENYYLYIQTELCEYSLSEFTEANHDIPEKMVWNFLADLLAAIAYLHNRDLIHLDIKPDNIFIASGGVYKLGDFGLMVASSNIDSNEVTEGDPKYLAKELMQGIFTKAADIFSLGITTLEFACDLELPSRGEGWQQLREGKMPESFFNKLSPELRMLIQQMMHPDYHKRYSADQLLKNVTISRVSKKRKIMSTIRNSARIVGNFFIHLFLFVFKMLFIPHLYSSIKNKFSHNLTQESKTPPHTSRISSKDWDQSFSDDEYFENSLIISPISDDYSSIYNGKQNHTDSSFLNNTTHSLFHSTMKRPKKTCNSSSLFLPTTTPLRKRISTTSDALTTRKITSPLESSFSFRERISFCDLSDDEDDTSLSTNPIGPKNLLNIFEEIESEGNGDIETF